MITFVHRVDSNNLGDMVCCPRDYFDFSWTEHRVIDIHQDIKGSGDVIFGGGGMLCNNWIESIDKFAYERHFYSRRRAVMWGAGTNVHGMTRLIWPKFLDLFDLVGLCDWGNPWTYIPCVSCMHPLFETARQVKPSLEVVFYQHADHQIQTAYPMRTNRCHKDELGQVLAFLGSAQVVVTNVFHGAYWSLLLGKRVILFEPFSNRFYRFKTRLPVVSPGDSLVKAIQDVSASHKPDLDFYHDCRRLNQWFYGRVKTLLTQ